MCSRTLRTGIKSVLLGGYLFFVFGFHALAQELPRYKYDASWPKQLPNHWMLGEVEGIAVDKLGHIWVTHERDKVRPYDPVAAQKLGYALCCTAAPSVVEFDTEGNALKFWGGENFIADWPVKEHDIFVDANENVWIAGIWIPEFNLSAWRDKDKLLWDRQVLKFSSDGKLLLKIGHPSKDPINNQDTTILGGPGSIQVDEAANEVYIADGYMNKRIVVYDSNTGAFKRGWAAYGIPLSEIDNSKLAIFDPSTPPFDAAAAPSKQFIGPVAEIRLSVDGQVYVADSGGHRIQIFTKQGKFVKEFFVAPHSKGRNSIGAMEFSRDAKQKFLFASDEESELIWVLNRNDGAVVGKIVLKEPGVEQILKIDSILLDSRGNMYIGDGHNNQKIQRWLVEK